MKEEPERRDPKESVALVVALSGPIVFVTNYAVYNVIAYRPWLEFMSYAPKLALYLAMAGFVLCVVRIVMLMKKREQKLLWVLMGLLNLMLVLPEVFEFVQDVTGFP